MEYRNLKLAQDFMHLLTLFERNNKVGNFTKNLIERTTVYSKCTKSVAAGKAGRIHFVNDRLLNAAYEFNVSSRSKLCIVNAGDCSVPGGGVSLGYPFAEESLCRSTNLYKSLSCRKVLDRFYDSGGSEYGSSCVVYSPKVIQLKTDDRSAEFLKHWFLFDVVTLAAPSSECSEDTMPDLKGVLLERLLLALKVASVRGVDTVVLNCLNYEKFGYPRELVAEVIGCVLAAHRNYFDDVLVSVWDYVGSGIDDFEFFKSTISKRVFN